MKEQINLANTSFENYFNSFTGLSEEQEKNFKIKKDHSYRVAELAFQLAEKQELAEDDKFLAYFIGLFHDVGRFRQLIEYNTFDDSKSVDHAGLSIEVLRNGSFMEQLDERQIERALLAIEWHNKKELPKGLNEEEMLFAGIIRDADKLDILKVLTDYYSNSKVAANHTLTWEMPKGSSVSEKVLKQIMKGILVSKEYIKSELDIKVMQMSWVYDLNFKASFGILMEQRFLEKIYQSMPKNDAVIEVYRKVKVFAENKFVASNKAVVF